MTTKQIQFNPVFDEKIPQELHPHLQFMYDRFQNHATAISNLTAQINELKAQIKGK
jgi:hypothetical protein